MILLVVTYPPAKRSSPVHSKGRGEGFRIAERSGEVRIAIPRLNPLRFERGDADLGPC